jgi:hypothetical protein
LCAFSAPCWTRHRLRPPAKAPTLLPGALPSSLWGEPSGNPHKSGGTNRQHGILTRDSDLQRKASRRARPSHQAASRVRRVLDGRSSWRRMKQPLGRGRPSPTMNGAGFDNSWNCFVILGRGLSRCWNVGERNVCDRRATPLRSPTCRRHIRDHIDHHMRHVVPACGGAIGILHEFQ